MPYSILVLKYMASLFQVRKPVDRNLLVALIVQFIETSLAVRYNMSTFSWVPHVTKRVFAMFI